MDDGTTVAKKRKKERKAARFFLPSPFRYRTFFMITCSALFSFPSSLSYSSSQASPRPPLMPRAMLFFYFFSCPRRAFFFFFLSWALSDAPPDRSACSALLSCPAVPFVLRAVDSFCVFMHAIPFIITITQACAQIIF